ncbi:MAG: hypothetical protein LRS49_00035, partial [Desulfurococcales archaeon]|nr:hypothetical protein [Desulfurococcales archaeon]
MNAVATLRRLLSRITSQPRPEGAAIPRAEDSGPPLAGGHERPEGPGIRVVAAYKIRGVEYTLYIKNGITRLHIREPPVDPERLAMISQGLAAPRGPEEEYHVERARSGYGPIYPLIIDPHIEEIACEGPGREVAVIHKLAPDRWV